MKITPSLASGRMRSLMCATLLATAALGFGGGRLHASDCAPAYRYEWVLRYECRQVPYTVCETRYNHCGRPYHVEVIRYRTERVSVWQLVAVPMS
jgi:hypothetical protein